MVAGSRFSRCEVRSARTNCHFYSNKVNQLSCIGIEKEILPALLLLSLLFLLASLSAAAQVSRDAYTVSVQQLSVAAKARWVYGCSDQRGRGLRL